MAGPSASSFFIIAVLTRRKVLSAVTVLCLSLPDRGTSVFLPAPCIAEEAVEAVLESRPPRETPPRA